MISTTCILILWPLLMGIMLLFMDNNGARKVALWASLVELAIALVSLFQFKRDASVQFITDLPWIPDAGIHFKVGIDGISMLLVLLTALLVPFIILSSAKHEYKNASVFYSLILFMQMALIGVFVALDGFLFYIFWELALIPIYFICLLWGGENRAKITLKFFIYTLTGSLFMLVAFIYLYLNTEVHYGSNIVLHSFDINALYEAGRSLSTADQGFVFIAIFLAFAIKMPVFPLHTWQPDTYTSAPAPGTMLLSGIMLKMGTYGLIRWLLPVVPLGLKEWGDAAIILSVTGIVYASCIAIVQKDYKRLIAYSSIAHVGLIAAGTLASNIQALQGAMIQMLSHGINVIGLFFIADILLNRLGTMDISQMGGIRHKAPRFTFVFMIIMLGSVALPLTNGFIGEFLLITGLYQYGAWMAAFAGLSVILGAVYMLRSFQSIMLGETNKLTEKMTDLDKNELMVLIPITILIVAMGIYPKFLLDISEPAIELILSKITL